MLFSFVGGKRCSVCPGTVLVYVPGEWVGESHVICDAHLLVVQIHTSSFGTGWCEEMVSVEGIWRLSMG
jgi:hypothetical protein